MLVLATLLRSIESDRDGRARKRDVLFPLALGLATTALVVGLQAAGLEPGPLSIAAMFAVPAVVCYTFLERPLRFALGIAALLLAGVLYEGVHGRAELRARSFFGVHRVTIDPGGAFRVLVHGNTVHGRQSLDPERRRTPLAYYHPSGPIGDLFRTMKGQRRRFGVVGLGAGALAAYARPGDSWTFFEIDPVVIAIARDSGYFTFIRDAAAPIGIVRGDARLTLAGHPERFDLLVVDAFSSDAIPVHLLTREALELYRARLAPGGLLAFHISNRYLDIEPILAALAADSAPPMTARVRDDSFLTDAEEREGKFASTWMVLAGSEADVAALRWADGWRRSAPRPGMPVWTDDYSNVLGALKRE